MINPTNLHAATEKSWVAACSFVELEKIQNLTPQRTFFLVVYDRRGVRPLTIRLEPDHNRFPHYWWFAFLSHEFLVLLQELGREILQP